MDLSVKRIRQFELFTCVGIAHADFVGGYDEVKRCYVADTGRSFEEDLELSDKASSCFLRHVREFGHRHEYPGLHLR